MVFEPQTLAPGPGIGVQAMATFRWRSVQLFPYLVPRFVSGMGEARKPKESNLLSLRAERPKTVVEVFSQSDDLEKASPKVDIHN